MKQLFPGPPPSLRQTMIMVVLVAIIVVSSIFMFSQFKKIEYLANNSREISRLAIGIERTIGFGGFIHHFKNAVLRPDEARYIEEARRLADRIPEMLQHAETVLAQLNLTIDLAPVRATFQQYVGMLTILEERGSSLTARELDELVRINDTDAIAGLTNILQREFQANAIALDQIRTTVSYSIVIIFGVFFLLSLYIFFLMRERAQILSQFLETSEKTSQNLSNVNQELRSFAYAISHDLKAPSNTTAMLLNEIKEIQADTIDPDSKELLEMATQSVDRMRTLIEEVLRYTRTIGQELHFAPVDLSITIQNAVDDLRAEIRDQDVNIHISNLPTVDGHAPQLHALFQNLIANAIKYRKKTGPCEITISSAVDGPHNRASIIIKDNGIGIPAEHHERIFGMFKRLHNHTSIAGAGLGLPLCRRIAINHGGEVAIASSSAKDGTTFVVNLPIVNESDKNAPTDTSAHDRRRRSDRPDSLQTAHSAFEPGRQSYSSL